jgi:hypothetical protein
VTALRSAKYLAGSKGAPCAFQIPGVCRDERETVVPCHIRDAQAGRSIKASDLSVGDGCHRCHEVFDRRAPMPDGKLISDEDWHFFALRALQRTLERRQSIGLLFIPLDPERLSSERPVKPRKPPEQRRAIPAGRPLESRSTFPPKGTRKLPSRVKERAST